MNSSRTLNQIFYNNKKFDSPKDILLLETHFLSLSQHEININRERERECEIKQNKIMVSADNAIPGPAPANAEPSSVPVELCPVPVGLCPVQVKTSWFEPLQKDTIFWCIFAFIYGHAEYLMVGTRYGNRELEEKTKMVTFFNASKKQLKNTNHKITNINIQEILSEFLSLQNETTFLGIIGLVTFYKIRILIVDEKKKLYLDFHQIDDPDCKTCILYKNTSIKGFVKYRMNMSADTDDSHKYIVSNMLCLEHFSKPLRAVSTYKLCELQDIADSIGITTDAKIKKPELYATISEYCNW